MYVGQKTSEKKGPIEPGLNKYKQIGDSVQFECTVS